MNIAIILAGGTGTRLGEKIPKQYIAVKGKPIFMYCLNTFQHHSQIDKIVVVAAYEWQNFVMEWIYKENIDKFICFATPGKSRQHSILNGLKAIKVVGGREVDNVVIHDAARPLVSLNMISKCIDGLKKYDGILPAIPAKDTMYLSEEGTSISSLLKRDHIYVGQSPESFRLEAYYKANISVPEEHLNDVRGSSEIAYEAGMRIGLIPGDEGNYKITTKIDLDKFKAEMKVKCENEGVCIE